MDSLSPRPTVPEDTHGILSLIAGIYAEYDCVLDAENDERDKSRSATRQAESVKTFDRVTAVAKLFHDAGADHNQRHEPRRKLRHRFSRFAAVEMSKHNDNSCDKEAGDADEQTTHK